MSENVYQIDFNKPESVHFIGIGGISMSGLAEILMDEGFTVSGSDAHRSELTDNLEARGAKVYIGQKEENIQDGIDVVVYTAAIHPDNPEFQEVKRRGIPMLTRAELLGEMMRNYKNAIAIAGTHGKTTTTSMVTEIFLQAKNDPTISVGGILPAIGGNIRVGGPEFFVTEACEYTNSFLSFYPTMAVILNIEEDHLDFFGYPSFLQAVCRARTGSGRDCHQRRYRELSGDHRSGKRQGYYFWSQPRQRLQCR